MFNVRPDLRVLGFNVREPEAEVPGFRLNADGAIGKAPTFRRELELIRSSANAIVDRPADAARVAYYGADERFGDPLLKWHQLGRGAMGYLARVGPVPLAPVALVGDTLRAFENGRQNLIDALLDGIQGER